MVNWILICSAETVKCKAILLLLKPELIVSLVIDENQIKEKEEKERKWILMKMIKREIQNCSFCPTSINFEKFAKLGKVFIEHRNKAGLISANISRIDIILGK